MDSLKERAKTLNELAENAFFYIDARPLQMNEKAEKLLAGGGRELLAPLKDKLAALDDWSPERMEEIVKAEAEAQELKLGKLAQPLRAALSGSNISPGIYDVMDVLGRDETLGRLDDALRQ